MHQRVGLHQVAFMSESSTVFVDHFRNVGLRHMTLVTPIVGREGGLEEAKQALKNGGPLVECLNHPFAFSPDLERAGDEATRGLTAAIEMAAALGAKSIYMVTGGRGRLS